MTKALVDSPPRLIARISPSYPAHAEIAHIEGFVVARLLVGLQGQVERVKIIKARPVGTFEAAARAAIVRWRFRPASFRGRPVRTWVRQRLVFRLQ